MFEHYLTTITGQTLRLNPYTGEVHGGKVVNGQQVTYLKDGRSTTKVIPPPAKLQRHILRVRV